VSSGHESLKPSWWQGSDAATVDPADGSDGLPSAGFGADTLSTADALGSVPGDVSVEFGDFGQLSYRWSASAGGGPYRVAVSDEYLPWSPDVGRAVAMESDTQAYDGVPLVSAVRHVTVWQAPPDGSRPTMIAQAQVVAPVQDVQIREDSGYVIGAWNVPEGVKRVAIYRIPESDPGLAQTRPQFEIQSGDDNLEGFIDHSGTPGRTYVYRVFSVVDDAGREARPRGSGGDYPRPAGRVVDLRAFRSRAVPR
jgi:hypothetical protein